MEWWNGYGRETGAQLPSPPEFEDDHRPPRVNTCWLALRWKLFKATSNKTSRNTSTSKALFLLRQSGSALREDERNALSVEFLDEFLKEIFGKVSHTSQQKRQGRQDRLPLRVERVTRLGPTRRRIEPPKLDHVHPETSGTHEEVRRLVHSARWSRNDPVMRLPPDATHEYFHSITTGLSAEHSETLAKALGVELGAGFIGIHAALTTRLQEQFGLKLQITEKEEQATRLTLSNRSPGSRLFALWHVEYQIKVDALAATPTSSAYHPEWLPLANVEFVTNTDPVVTFTDVALGRR